MEHRASGLRHTAGTQCGLGAAQAEDSSSGVRVQVLMSSGAVPRSVFSKLSREVLKNLKQGSDTARHGFYFLRKLWKQK